MQYKKSYELEGNSHHLVFLKGKHEKLKTKWQKVTSTIESNNDYKHNDVKITSLVNTQHQLMVNNNNNPTLTMKKRK